MTQSDADFLNKNIKSKAKWLLDSKGRLFNAFINKEWEYEIYKDTYDGKLVLTAENHYELDEDGKYGSYYEEFDDLQGVVDFFTK